MAHLCLGVDDEGAAIQDAAVELPVAEVEGEEVVQQRPPHDGAEGGHRAAEKGVCMGRIGGDGEGDGLLESIKMSDLNHPKKLKTVMARKSHSGGF